MSVSTAGGARMSSPERSVGARGKGAAAAAAAALAARNWRRTAVLLAALTLLGLQMVHNLRLRRVRAGGGGAELGGDHFQARVDHHPSPLRAATGRHRLDQADPGGGGRL